jgi:hypothetical protein
MMLVAKMLLQCLPQAHLRGIMARREFLETRLASSRILSHTKGRLERSELKISELADISLLGRHLLSNKKKLATLLCIPWVRRTLLF